MVKRLVGLGVVIASVASLLISAGATPASASTCTGAAPFPDVPTSSVFCNDIVWLAGRGITEGYADGKFHPTAAVTREQMAAYLYRYGHSDPPPACTTKPFPDVPTTSAFCGDIEWFASSHITTGDANGNFDPADAVSRQAMAAFLARFARASNSACASAPFPDVSVFSPFCPAITWLVAKHITAGYPDGKFHGADSVTREQMAAFLHRYATLPPVGIPVGPGPQTHYMVQAQPPAGSCHYRVLNATAGQYLPDASCNPGATNPKVTQSTIQSTICVSGYTASIRPPTSVTDPEKVADAKSYSYTGSLTTAEYDHLIPLELGGDPNDARNLWVEPNQSGAKSTYNPKDTVEGKLNSLVCDGKISLVAAQDAIVANWTTALATVGYPNG